MSLSNPEPLPIESSNPPLLYLVVSDMQERKEFGEKKYGMPLTAWNSRDALVDAYQEALDLCVYLRQAIYERDGK